MEIPEFNTKKELFDFLVTNKNTLIAQKKAATKYADAFIFPASFINTKEGTNKAGAIDTNPNEIKVKIVVNTTNLIDSHRDCHLKGLWKKTLQENKMLMHLQEHNMSFKAIISDGKDLKAHTEDIGWLQLGYNYQGTTEALIFESLIKRERNEYMFEQYRKGYVRNHSVGMRYVQLVMCINDENYGAEYEAWQKYYPEVANKDVVNELECFWAVKEAKLIEGSAVPVGSNMATPTISVESKNQPEQSTEQHTEPQIVSTQKVIDYKYLINNLKRK